MSASLSGRVSVPQEDYVTALGKATRSRRALVPAICFLTVTAPYDAQA
jgi:hypothetical protein